MFLQSKLRYLGSDEGMTNLNKLWQTYILTALNTKEAHSKQKHDDIAKFKIGDLIMIKIFDKKLNWDAKYVPNFRVVKLIGTTQKFLTWQADFGK